MVVKADADSKIARRVRESGEVESRCAVPTVVDFGSERVRATIDPQNFGGRGTAGE